MHMSSVVPLPMCPFVERHYVFGQNRPFCTARKPTEEIKDEQAYTFTCCRERYKICIHYYEAIVNVASEQQRVLADSQTSLDQSFPSLS